MSYHFNLHPWDVPRLSNAEWMRYLDALAEITQANREAQRTR